MYQTNTIMELIGVTRATVNHFENTGKLKAVKDLAKNRWIVEKEDLADFLIENQKYLEYFMRHAPSKRLKVAYTLLLNTVNFKIKTQQEVNLP